MLFVWVSIDERQLSNQVELYSSLGWNSLVCMADFLNPFVHEKATSLAFSLLGELVEDLRRRPCPLVFASFSGGSKACMHKVFQIIEGACEAELNPDDNLLVTSCISGQIYDSGPVDFTGELGARFALHPNIVKMLPGSAKVATFLAKSVTTSLDALFLTSFRSKQAEFWHTLYSSVGLGAPFLILCSENDDLAPYASIYKFAQRIQDLGGNVKLVKWRGSGHLGHYEHCPIQYRAAVSKLLEHALSIFSQKTRKIGERKGTEGMHEEISDLICDLQNVAVDSNQSLRRVAIGPNDHFFLPSSAEYQTRESSSLEDEPPKEKPSRSSSPGPPPSINPNSVLGQLLFDACVPKNIEGWDIKFSGSLNGRPFASASKRSPLNAIKRIRRSRL